MKSFTKKHILKSVSVKMHTPKFLDPVSYHSSELSQDISHPHLKIMVSNKQREAQIFKEAEIKGQTLIQEAQKKAAEIIKAAEAEREIIRKRLEQELEQELRAKITAEAKTKGYEEGMEKAKKTALEMQKQAKKYLDFAQSAFFRELKRTEKELIDLSIKISEKIIGVSLDLDPGILLSIIQKLIIAADKVEKFKIYVSPEDYKWLQELPEEIKPNYPIGIDSGLENGNTYLESKEGFFIGQINSQLDTIREALLKELEDGQLAAAGSNS
jgi:flagellar assembly protein FliH